MAQQAEQGQKAQQSAQLEAEAGEKKQQEEEQKKWTEQDRKVCSSAVVALSTRRMTVCGCMFTVPNRARSHQASLQDCHCLTLTSGLL
jgi:hypothetical protein